MSVSNTEIFGPMLEKANLWLKDLMMELELIDRHKAYLALKAVLQTLRDRLTVEEVAQLGAQLPMLIRGLYYEGWDPSGKPVKERQQEEFLDHVKSHFRGDERFFAQRMTRGVFKVLSKRISEGEIEDIKHVLPKELRDLWP